MDPKKAAAEWFYQTVFRDEPIRAKPAPRPERVPALIRTARSLENGAYQNWQTREVVFMKQGRLLANFEDDYEFSGNVTCYYPTYQALTDRQLRGYFSWRTRLRRGEVERTSLSFAFLYVYELLNQIGVDDPLDGYRKLEHFLEVYGQIDDGIQVYLTRWMQDYVVYYELDRALLADAPQVLFDRSVMVLEHIQEQEPGKIIRAVRQLAPKWLDRSKFYAEHREDMDTVLVRVLRRVSAHCDARCKKSMAEQYFGPLAQSQARMFDAAIFCNPLKRRNYEYAVDGQWVYTCRNGLWYVLRRDTPSGARGKLDALVKTVDAAMREAYEYGHPVKAEVDTKWVAKIIAEEIQAVLDEKQAAEAKKISIDYAQLGKIRQDAAVTREKLIVDEEREADMPAPGSTEPVSRLPEPQEPPSAAEGEQLELCFFPEQDRADKPAPQEAESPEDTPLSPAEYRLLQCLLYGGDMGWVQAGGHMLSVLADSVNEKLYDTFLDTVLDGDYQVIDDYIDDLKEMVRP